MDLITITITSVMVLALILAFIGMWNSNTDRPSDYDLYGMDADEYLKQKTESPKTDKLKEDVCTKCSDLGWVYSECGTYRKICPCHY